MPRCRDAKSGICPPSKSPALRIFILTLGLLTGVGTSAACLPEGKTEPVTVERVHDGDTVILRDGRKLRVIGVDTPELANDRHPAEPLALDAREYVRDLLWQHRNKIELHYDRELFDSYQRQLAHVFLPDNRNLSEALLQKGLATTLVVPPNTRYANCYAKAENDARGRPIGLWALSRYKPVEIGQLRKTNGFRVVRGDVQGVRRYQHADYIYVGKSGSDQKLRIKIAAEDRPYFDETFLKTLANKRVEVRGRIHHKKGRFLSRIRYPTALQILTP
ncbi:MAG TPA: thermonuclease family protein [Gammaproteobacteria bacterium]